MSLSFCFKRRLSLCLLCTLLAVGGCRDDEFPTTDYGLPVTLEVDLRTEGLELLAPLGYLTIPTPRYPYEHTGLGGIVLVHALGELGAPYVAYDLACPYERRVDCRIAPATSGHAEGFLVFECPACHRAYELGLGTGSMIGDGGSPRGLVRYRVLRRGDRLRVESLPW